MFIEKSPTEENLSPSFWTCFSHYHEKVATLRNAFFDITHSGRKKHSSLLGALLAEMPPAQKNTPRCKGRFRGRCPPAPKKTSLVVRDVFDGDAPQLKKTSLVVRDVFFGADNQIRTGDLVLTKDVFHSKKRKCSKKIKTAENTQYLVLFPPFSFYFNTI